ncbi:MAG: glycosyltransferase family 2 protein [Patescibacteria group bacterium]|nr:glycosyltransferase family 2 protein [Patescibacteria group bacterium]
MTEIEINRKKKFYRFWEIVPGFLTWSVFIIPVVLSFFYPFFVAYLIIIFALYWLIKSIIMSIRLIIGYLKYKESIKINWLKKCQESYLADKFKGVYHLIILATFKEELEILRTSIQAVANSNFPLNKIIFVLATEEKDRVNARKYSKILKKEFGDRFYKFYITEHPQNIIGEVRGKGSNITYSAKCALKYIQTQGIDPKNIIVTTLDADNRIHEQYLANLTYHYVIDNDPLHKSYQPIPMFFNNIWEVPIPLRSIAVGSSFWQMIESTRPYRMRNFSSHAQSLAALIKTNFWSTKTIVEDGHQFWRTYFAFNGQHQVVPLYVPIYQDAVLSPISYIMTFWAQYVQKRRWAWGCSDIPYVMTNIIGNKNLPFGDKWMQAFRLIEGHFSWATTSVILAFVGWLPGLVNPHFRDTVLAYNFPVIYSRLLTTALIGLAVTLTISTLLLPPRPKRIFNFSIIFEWIISPILLPISNIVFSSITAIDAQTRLMIGKYLEFIVTEKKFVDYHHHKTLELKINKK